MISPTDFQYSNTASKTPSTDGLTRLARGWFDRLGNLVIPADAPTRATSPTDFQYKGRTMPVVRSPTDFQYDQQRQSTTVDIDGGVRLFDDLKEAAKKTLLTNLDGALQDFGVSRNVQATPVNDVRGGDGPGLPVTTILAVAVVGGLIYMKWG